MHNPMIKTKVATIAFFAMTIAGCATQYKIPEGSKTATLHISLDKPPLTGGFVHIYNVDTKSCPSPKVSEIIEHYRPGLTETVTIEAGKDLYLRIHDGAPVGTGIPGYTCIHGTKFKPESGAEYELKYTFNGQMCYSEIFRISAATKTPEPSSKLFIVKEAVEFCGK